MKKIYMFLLLFSSGIASAQSTTITDNGGFGVISDVESAKYNAFLSYTGRMINHCGIRLVTPRFSGVNGPRLQSVLLIRVMDMSVNKKDISIVKNDVMLAEVADPEEMLFGQMFVIETRDPSQTIREAVQLLSVGGQKVDVLVENLPCD